MTTTSRMLLLGVAAAVLAVLGTIAWFLADDAPAEVDIAEAADAVGAERDAAAATGDVDGTWTVDTTVGEFSVLDTTGTFVGFRIDEELANIGATEAVGRTPDVTGEVVLADGVLEAATFRADLATLQSDEPRRNTRMYNALDAGSFPFATFTLTEPVAVGDLADGQVAEVEAVGTLEVKGVTNDVVVPLQAVLEGDVAVVTGSFRIAFADYGVDVPTAPIVLSVADVGDVEFQLFLTR